MNTVFTELFGNSPKSRVMDELLVMIDHDMPVSAIAENAKVSVQMAHTFLKELETKKLVICTRKVGNASMYQLNTKHPLVQHMENMFNQLLIPQN